MTSYSWSYRLGITPWERYAATAGTSIAAMLDREEAERSNPPGRALDLGCGRGGYTRDLATRGWQAVGIDNVPAAIAAAKVLDPGGAGYLVADVTDLPSGLGTFDFFLDIGCFQGLNPGQRSAQARGIRSLANPGATLLQLSFGPGRWRSLVGGVSQADVEAAFPDWEMLAVEAADTAGLGWPMNTTGPQWYRLRLTS